MIRGFNLTSIMAQSSALVLHCQGPVAGTWLRPGLHVLTSLQGNPQVSQLKLLLLQNTRDNPPM